MKCKRGDASPLTLSSQQSLVPISGFTGFNWDKTSGSADLTWLSKCPHSDLTHDIFLLLQDLIQMCHEGSIEVSSRSGLRRGGSRSRQATLRSTPFFRLLAVQEIPQKTLNITARLRKGGRRLIFDQILPVAEANLLTDEAGEDLLLSSSGGSLNQPSTSIKSGDATCCLAFRMLVGSIERSSSSSGKAHHGWGLDRQHLSPRSASRLFHFRV